MASEPVEQAKSHSRSRSQQGSRAGDRSHTRGKPSRSSQKAMLSKALQKANTAVQLDNAQNFEGARVCYLDACDLLQQVLQKTTSEEDQRKLEAIRKTYTSRIEELDQLAYEEFTDDKALPARPRTASYPSSTTPSLQAVEEANEDALVFGTTTNTNLAYGGDNDSFMNGPLSPRPGESTRFLDINPTASSALPDESRDVSERILQPHEADTTGAYSLGPDRGSIPISGSWLDAQADSGGSGSSSVHSKTSSRGIQRKHVVRPPSGGTEAEFDAALDAAVEAAYDDGYEPAADSDEDHASLVANALMRVQLAKERVRQSEKETMELNQGRGMQQSPYQHDQPTIREDFYDDESSDEEERLLEEMTRGYEIEDFAFSQQFSALDQNRGTAAFDSNTVDAEGLPKHRYPDDDRGARDVSSRTEMKLGPTTTGSDSDPEDIDGLNTEQRPAEGVRNRRMSGQNPKQLKIETSRLGQMRYHEPIREVDPAEYGVDSQGGDGSPDRVPESLKLLSGGSPTDADPHGRPESFSPVDDEDDGFETVGSPLARSLLTKNYSSSSLRSARSRNYSLSHLDDISDLSPGTPSSNPFGSTTRLPTFSAASTPMVSSFDDQLSADPAESLYLFDGQYHNLSSPGSPDSNWEDAPVELEPCPSDFLLRPFWLMRCLYQTIAHPRGGYLSSRLFVPQDVWRVKGVKLRNLEDKVATCDFLTATLLKLGQVDTFDADAVLEEMQGLEGVLDQMALNLGRKLGAEVGVQNSGIMFKDSSNGADAEQPSSNVPRSASVSGRSAAPFSWRRLRAKNSAAGLNASYNGNSNGNGLGGENGMDSPGLDSLPMTLQPTSKPPKRALDQARFSGPHAGYMESLARLFDAAQTVDQIARQVEDPGLRHADKTQVGLELCTRHAAEFFSFYICRFVLSDLNTLLDKFVKRGTEWVVS